YVSGGVSLRLTPLDESNGQGALMGDFYRDCDVDPLNPIKDIFGVVPVSFSPIPYYCGDIAWRTILSAHRGFLTLDAVDQPPNPLKRTDSGELTPGALSSMVLEAEARWISAGLDESRSSDFGRFRVQIGDLPESRLGWTSGDLILIDRDAAGFG